MTDIRRELNERRRELAQLADQDREMLRDRRVQTDAYQRAVDRQREREHTESTLATYQLADAQLALVEAQERATVAQIAATEQLRRANEAEADKKRTADADSEKAKSRGEEVSFWYRRFLNSVAIANAAGFVATLNFMLSDKHAAVPSAHVTDILGMYGMGAAFGALLPLVRLLKIFAQDSFTGEGSVEMKQRFPRLYRGALFSAKAVDITQALLATAAFVLATSFVIGGAVGHYRADEAARQRVSEGYSGKADVRS